MEREQLLLKNDVMLSALYTDPRFNFMLTAEQKLIAQDHLRKLVIFVQSNKRTDQEVQLATSPITSSDSQRENGEETDELTSTFESKISVTVDSINDAEQEILSYRPEGMRNCNINALDYWKIQSKVTPILAEVAQIIHCVPATQVTVERVFSKHKRQTF